MKILMCAKNIPYPPTEGDTLRIYNISKILSKEHTVYLLFTEDSDKCKERLELLKKLNIFANIIPFSLPNYSKFKKLVLLLAPFLILSTESYINKGSLKYKLLEIIDNYNIDVVHCQDLYISLILTQLNVCKLFDRVDSTSLNVYREILSQKLDFNKIYKLLLLIINCRSEYNLLNKFQITTVVSPTDKDFLSKLAKKAKIHVIPNGVDAQFFSPKKALIDQNSILFLGNMNYPPNVDCVKYIHNNILPLIKSQIPDIKFYIVGQNPTKEVLELNGRSTIVTGYVKDTRPYLDISSIFVVIMHKGSGIKNKILEAMAMEKPIVANDMAIEGLSTRAMNGIFVGTNDDEIANHIINLLNDKELISRSGKINRSNILKYYTWDSTVERYVNLYKKLLYDFNHIE